jgi:hypothetical protein
MKHKKDSKYLIIILAVVFALLIGIIYLQMFTKLFEEEVEVKQLEGFNLLSKAFKDKESIPTKYTCDGDDISPPLYWEGFPNETKTFVLIVEDPDAPLGVFTHWVIFNIPKDVTSLKENIPKIDVVKGVGIQGKNDFGKIGYGGPCPPLNEMHRYVFKLYALDTTLNLNAGATKGEVLKAMSGHVLAVAKLTGTYTRKGT